MKRRSDEFDRPSTSQTRSNLTRTARWSLHRPLHPSTSPSSTQLSIQAYRETCQAPRPSAAWPVSAAALALGSLALASITKSILEVLPLPGGAKSVNVISGPYGAVCPGCLAERSLTCANASRKVKEGAPEGRGRGEVMLLYPSSLGGESAAELSSTVLLESGTWILTEVSEQQDGRFAHMCRIIRVLKPQDPTSDLFSDQERALCPCFDTDVVVVCINGMNQSSSLGTSEKGECAKGRNTRLVLFRSAWRWRSHRRTGSPHPTLSTLALLECPTTIQSSTVQAQTCCCRRRWGCIRPSLFRPPFRHQRGCSQVREG